MDFARLWISSRDGYGVTTNWPDGGGLNEQAAWTFDAFRLLAGVNAALEKMERGED